MPEQKTERIKTWMAVALGMTALSIDAFGALLTLVGIGVVMTSIISPVAFFGFTVWFWMLGVTFIKSPKKLAAMGISALVGLIPFLNVLPELTVGVMITAFLTIAEDKGGTIGGVANLVQGKTNV